MKLHYELIQILSLIAIVIISVFFTKAIWESNMPEWLKFLILR